MLEFEEKKELDMRKNLIGLLKNNVLMSGKKMFGIVTVNTAKTPCQYFNNFSNSELFLYANSSSQ